VKTPAKNDYRFKRAQLILAAVASAAVLFCGPERISASQNTQPDCRIDTGACVRTSGALSVVLDIAPKPVQSMHELTFTVTVTEKDNPIRDASVIISLSMPGMFMGENVVRLKHRVEGVYEGKGVIVRCPSGKKIWQASVIIKRGEKKTVVNYVLEVP
jgi:YtkA-like